MINLAKLLQLDRPIGTIDAETTGLDPETDRVIQIALTVHYVNRDPISWVSLINPGIPIVNNVHGITDEMVKEAPTFAQIAPALAPKILNIDLVGANVEFDLGFMHAEMKRAGVAWPWNGHLIDILQIYYRKFPRNLEAAHREFGGAQGEPLPEGTSLDGAHDAGVDVRATETVLHGQLHRYPDLPRTVKALSEFCFPRRANAIDQDGKIIWHEGEACISIGKFAKNGPYPLRKLDKGYLEFMSGPKTSFSDEVKQIFRAAIMGVFPVPPVPSTSVEGESL